MATMAETKGGAPAPAGEDDRGRWLRRAVSFSLVFVALSVLSAALPVALVVAAVVDVIGGRRLALTRAYLFLVWFLVAELMGLCVAFILWAARPVIGARAYLAGNYALQAAWVQGLMGGMQALFGARIALEGVGAAAKGPLILLVRHASSGDALLPISAVTGPLGLWPRYVLKEELRWDPCLDVVGHRVPNAFVRRGAGAGEAEKSAALAEGLGERDVVVLYPEGTRFSARGRERRLAELEARQDPLLERARALEHTLPPHSGGVLALLERAPGVDVAFLAHAGFDRVRTLGDLFRGALIGARIEGELWRVPAAEIPADEAGRRAWLFDQWARIDRWVAERGRSGAA